MFSLFSSASDRFWVNVLEKNHTKINNKSVIINGEITHIKRKYNARDIYFYVDLKDKDSDRYITLTLYTLKRLKRINYFECKVGSMFRVSGKFKLDISGKQVGTLIIDSKNKDIKCFNKDLKPRKL
jgi:hypothetical protein